ncbi:MAG: hypothetical protein GX214_06730 [Clostridiales bacterium]|nr:hypothetical protein [Clostridiales bacterium]
MKKYTKAVLVVLLAISIGLNVNFYEKTRVINEKLNTVNKIIASNVESNIRHIIMYIDEFIEGDSLETLQNLGNAVDTLNMTFNYWVDLNQSEKEPNEKMQQASSSIETLRNTIGHHLLNQYKLNDNKLMSYDIEMLKAYSEQLKKLLMVYHNIEDRLSELKNPEADDGGLSQVASSMEEIGRLYRHSKIPNQHPTYMAYTKALSKVAEKIPEVVNLAIKEENNNVYIKEGVHYYELNYYDEDEEVYKIWIDAIDGHIRNLEYKRDLEGRPISQIEAIDKAKDFLRTFYQGEIKKEMFYTEDMDADDVIYSFKFIPINDDIQIICDTHTIDISSSTGEVIKYTNNFNDTRVMIKDMAYTPEDIMEEYGEEYKNMEYRGQMIVRSFYTRFQPKLAYAFGILKDEQPMLIFIDGDTGIPIYETYYLYHTIF